MLKTKKQKSTAIDTARKIDSLTKAEHRKNVEEWLKFSTTPQSEEDILTKLKEEIAMERSDFYVCISYICRFSKLSENFIEQIEKITSVDRKVPISIKGTKRTKWVWKKSSRLDWNNICQYQKLSEEFIERHENDVLWELIYQYQDLSDEFKRKHIDQLNQDLQSRILKSDDIDKSTSDD